MQEGLRIMAQAARFVVDDALQARAALLDLEKLVDLLLVFHHGEACLGVLQHIGDLVGDGVLVKRDRDAAQRLHGGDGPVKARAVVADDSHLVAAPDTEGQERSEEHTSELQSLMRISYAVFCLKKKNKQT